MKLKKALLSVCSVLCLVTTLVGCSFGLGSGSTSDGKGNSIGGGIVDDGSSDVVGTEGVKYWIPDGENYAIAYGYEGEEKNITIASEYNGMPVTEIDPNTYYMNHEDEMNELSDKILQDQFFGFWGKILNVVIPDSVTSIGDGAFYECSSLTSVVIPDSVTKIGDAFSGCDNLTDIYITDIAAWCGIDGVGYVMGSSLSKKKLYLNGELVTELIIPDGVTNIDECAFWGCSNLASVVIPNSVTKIGAYAFDECNLTSVTFKNPNGWRLVSKGVSEIDATVLADSATAAEFLDHSMSNEYTEYLERIE